MKPNSCLYRAVKKVVEYQFGITDLSCDVFDKHNIGEGVPTGIMVSVIDEALDKYGVKVFCVYARISDIELFDHPELVIEPSSFIPAPCIGHVTDHVEGILPNDAPMSADMAIVLERVQ